MTKAEGTIKHNDWDEKTYFETGPHKLTKADINCVLTGDIDGKAKTAFLMTYSNETYAHYAGYLVVEASMGGKAGSFVIYEDGEWDNGVARSRWTIVKGSGAGAFKGISGTGSYAAQHDKTVHYTLDYTL